MLQKLKNYIFLFLLVIFTGNLFAQMPSGKMGGQNMNMGHIYGKVLDSTSKKPIESVSVVVTQSKMDSITKKRKDVVVGGMLTTKNGEFSIEGLNIMASYKLKITAIGFKIKEQKVGFEMNMAAAKSGDLSTLLNGVDKDLGNFSLIPDAQVLQGVTVVSTKPLLTMSIDRKIFNVEKNLTSTGGTAVDVMKNVPGVSVDIDGNVAMRNAAPQIFVDGRPTTMTLDQIPADDIATVEIITNPSAKFDASGGGAGILNIVLKKNKKAGYNGNIRASVDSRGKPGFGGDINIKQQKVNFFASGMLGFRKSISNVSTNRTDYYTTTNAISAQTNNPISKGIFAFGRLGMDYFINNRNTITIGGNIVRGQFKNKDFLNSNVDTVYKPIGLDVYENDQRTSNSIGNFKNYGATLSYKKNFTKSGKELTADANYNYSKNDNNSNNIQQQFYVTGAPKGLNLNQISTGGGTNGFLTLQTDYANPITKTLKIEAGLRAAFRNYANYNNIRSIYSNTIGTTLKDTNIYTNYTYNDQVYAGYTTLSQQLNKFTYQLGLRLESSIYQGNIITSGNKFSNQFPFSLFPSAFLTYKLTDREDVQINYSRKVNRPNFFQLTPFYDISDPLNYSVGNPNLVPEFTNLVELGYSNQINNKHTFLGTLYFKNTNNLITKYQYRGINPNPNIKDSATITTYANANRSYTYGTELTMKDKFFKWWDITSNINLYQTDLKAGNIAGTANQSQFSWFAKMSHNIKLPKNFSFQASGEYQAKSITPVNSGGGGRGGMMFGFGGQSSTAAQGYNKANYSVDIALKKEFLKNNAASLTLQMNDIFRTKLAASYAHTSLLTYDTERRRDPQVLRLAFNWKFGKTDVSLFKKKNLKNEMENMQNVQQGVGGN